MTFNEIVQMFPRGETLCGGFYENDEIIKVDSWEALLTIDSWKDNPFEPMDRSIPFLVYVPQYNHFILWWFSYDVVSGYYTEDGENWDLVCFSESFGDERYDPFDKDSDQLIVPPPTNGQSRQQQIAERFVEEPYVFMTAEEVKSFALKNIK